MLKALDAYLNCGILLHGCALAECELCRHGELVAFSCKRRCLCPSCDAKRALLFGEHLHQNVLLPYPYAHVTFSVPKRIRPFFKFDRMLLKHLYHAAWRAWQDAVDDELPMLKTGAVMALHSAGDLLHFHPHAHALCLYGALDEQGVFYQLESVDLEFLARCFRDHVLDALLEAQLLDEETVRGMQTWQHSGFHVFVGEPVSPDDADARCFLGRYLKKCPVSLARLELLGTEHGHMVRICSTAKGEPRSRTLDPLDFLAELQCHIPNTFEQTVRFFGVMSSRTRGAKRLALDFPGSLPLSEPPHKPSAQWARCIKQVYLVDPLVCPKCGGTMRIKSFILDPRETGRLCKHFGLVAGRAPPPLSVASLRYTA